MTSTSASCRGAALLRTAYLLTGDRHLAEDLVQVHNLRGFTGWAVRRCWLLRRRLLLV